MGRMRAGDARRSETDAPGRGGSDSHRPHVDVTKNPVMIAARGFEPVPLWVPVVFAALLMWGGYYIGASSFDFRRDPRSIRFRLRFDYDVMSRRDPPSLRFGVASKWGVALGIERGDTARLPQC